MNAIKESFLVFLGACLGGLARYGVSLILPSLAGLSLGTLVVNYLGTFFLIFLVKGYLTKRAAPSGLILLAGTGFCGAFTTFSSAMLDLFKLLQAGAFLSAGLYSAGLILGGLAVAYLSLYLAERLGA